MKASHPCGRRQPSLQGEGEPSLQGEDQPSLQAFVRMRTHVGGWGRKCKRRLDDISGIPRNRAEMPRHALLI